MARGPIGGLRPALAAVALLPLLAGCWWLESEPGPGEWRHRSGTIGDFRPHHTATLFEADSVAQLQLECSQGPVTFAIAPDREAIPGDTVRLPVRYRLDAGAPVAVTAFSGGNYLWLRDPQQGGGEDPMVAQIAAARQLLVQIEWSPADRQTLRFDVSRAADAVARLREKCGE